MPDVTAQDGVVNALHTLAQQVAIMNERQIASQRTLDMIVQVVQGAPNIPGSGLTERLARVESSQGYHWSFAGAFMTAVFTLAGVLGASLLAGLAR